MLPHEWISLRDEIIASWPSLGRILGNAGTEAIWRRELGGADVGVAREAVKLMRSEWAEGKTVPVLGAFEAAVRRVARERNRGTDVPAADVVDNRQWALERLNEFQDAYAKGLPNTPERKAKLLSEINAMRHDLGLGPYEVAS